MQVPHQPLLKLRPDLAEIPALAACIESCSVALGLPMADENAIALAAEELFVNTVHYGGSDTGTASVEIQISVSDGVLTFTYSDAGVAFDPTDPEVQPPPEDSVPTSDRPIGGLGIHFIKTMMESIRYARQNDRNVLTMTRRLGSGRLAISPE
jgi:serine/threonine-protein kinase RsbW